MSILKFPKSLCKNISSHVVRFWWSSANKDHGIHWVKWSNMTTNKNKGGIGFKEFSIMNQALIAKQAWRLTNNTNSLWARILKGKYFTEGSLWNARKKTSISWAWESILKGKDILLQHGFWQIGDGKKVIILKTNGLRSILHSCTHPHLTLLL